MKHLTLVGQSISRDAEECAEELLRRIRRGEVLGIAFTALMPQRRFFTGVCGECVDDPHGVRSGLLSLDDELRDIIRGGDFEDTTR